MTNHVRLQTATYGLIINGWLQSFGDVAEVPMKVETAGTGYSIMGARGNSSSVTFHPAASSVSTTYSTLSV